MIDCHGTEKVEIDAIHRAVTELFNLSPAGIIETLNLLRPIYKKFV